MTKRRHVLSCEWDRALAQLMAASRECQTQGELARRSGIGQTTIGRILRGEVDPGIGTMTFLAVALRVPFTTLAGLAEGENAGPPNQSPLPDLSQILHDLRNVHSLIWTAWKVLAEARHGPEEYVLSLGVEALARICADLDHADSALSRHRRAAGGKE